MDIADSTRIKYDRLMKNMKHLEDFSDREATMEFMEEQTVQMRRSYLLALVNHLKCIDDREDDYKYYRKICRDICLEDSLNRVKRAPTEREKSSYISWSEVLRIRSIREGLKDRSNGDYMMYVIVCLYTYIPPQRGQVYYNCYIDKDVEGSNLIDLNVGKLFVRCHKTSKVYDTITINLPTGLIEVLIEYKSKCIDGRLLSTSTGRVVSNVSFNGMMERIFGSGISTNMLRKIYVTNMLADDVNMDIRKDIAKKMGHSVSTQALIYNKIGIKKEA